jgi:hypothetical protein
MTTTPEPDNGWTVGQLKEELDGYGDHLPVRIAMESGPDEYVWPVFGVDTRTGETGEVVLELRADWYEKRQLA